MKRTGLRSFAIVLILLGLVLVIYGAYLAITPNVYESIVRIKVEKDRPQISNLSGTTNPFDPYWLQTEFEKIHSKAILYPVITNLNLNKIWAEKLKRDSDLSTDESYALLRKNVEVRQYRSTSLIEIKARNQDARLTAAIANEIGEEYRRHRFASWRQQEQRANVAITNTLNGYEEKIHTLEEKIKQLGTNEAARDELHQELAKTKDLRDQLKGRIVSEKVPGHYSPVEIIDRAEPSLEPIYPNKRHMIPTAVLGMAFMIIGVMMTRKGNLIVK